VKNAILDDENIVARALAHFAVQVQHDGLMHAGVDGLYLGENVVEIIQTLDGWIKTDGWNARTLGHDDGHALLVHFRRIQMNSIHNNDGA